VVAFFDDGTSIEKISSVDIDNTGPPISFLQPEQGQVFSGSGIPIEISVLDNLQPPVRVSFFRETANSGPRFLGEDTTPPFQASFGVTDLPPSEMIVIKAVATDSSNRVTGITLTGFTNRFPVADAGSDVQFECNGGLTEVALDGTASFDPDQDNITYKWVGPFGTILGPNPAAFLALGTHPITLIVEDEEGLQSSDSVVISVVDTLPPTVEAGEDVILEATSPLGANFEVNAIIDDQRCSTSFSVSPSLTVFPLGTTILTVNATDCADNSASDTISGTVQDTTPPIVTPTNPSRAHTNDASMVSLSLIDASV
jgi:hypothetical protein